MALSALASSGYRVARSWQYADDLPDPPPTVVAAGDDAVSAGNGFRYYRGSVSSSGGVERPLLRSNDQQHEEFEEEQHGFPSARAKIQRAEEDIRRKKLISLVKREEKEKEREKAR